MRRFLSLLTLCLLFYSSVYTKEKYTHKVFQVSTIAAILKGVYESDFTIKKLKEFGDFGVGTVNGLDGELIAVQGNFYHITPRGDLKLAPSNMKIPFACVCFFEPESTFTIKNLSGKNEIAEELEKKFTNINIPYAFRINGTFPSVKLRSLNPQKKPYPPFSEAIKDQFDFELKDVKGSLVAFWYPGYLSGVNMPFLHLHFATEDRKKGGHVKDVQINTAEVKMMPLHQIEMDLPSTRAFSKADLEGDYTQILRRLEYRH